MVKQIPNFAIVETTLPWLTSYTLQNPLVFKRGISSIPLIDQTQKKYIYYKYHVKRIWIHKYLTNSRNTNHINHVPPLVSLFPSFPPCFNIFQGSKSCSLRISLQALQHKDPPDPPHSPQNQRFGWLGQSSSENAEPLGHRGARSNASQGHHGTMGRLGPWTWFLRPKRCEKGLRRICEKWWGSHWFPGLPKNCGKMMKNDIMCYGRWTHSNGKGVVLDRLGWNISSICGAINSFDLNISNDPMQTIANFETLIASSGQPRVTLDMCIFWGAGEGVLMGNP